MFSIRFIEYISIGSFEKDSILYYHGANYKKTRAGGGIFTFGKKEALKQ